MDTLNFDATANDSAFIEKTEQIRSAMRTTALDMEEYEQAISSSFQQMADNASLAAKVVENAITNMQKKINDATIALSRIDAENRMRLRNLQTDSEPSSNNDTEITSRETLSVDVSNQYNELALLNAELLVYQQVVEAAGSKLATMRTELASVCGEMEQMRNAGQENTEAYAALQDKAVELTGNIQKANKELINAPISNESFEGVISGLDGVSGAFSAATSMLGLFSIENETLNRIMQKVQLAISVTNGLQAVNTALSKDSAFQINVVGRLKLWWRSITLQAAAAQGIETTAATTGTAVNLGLAGSFRAVGLAISSIPLFGWILAGISALISLYAVWSSSTEDQVDKQNDLNESVKNFNESVQEHAAKPVAMIELLSTQFKALGNNVEAQKKFISDNKKEFDELGVSINNVKDAQQLLIDNKDQFIKAQIAKATSMAYTEKMQEEAKKMIDAQRSADVWQKVGEMKDDGTLKTNGSRYDKDLHKQAQKTVKQAKDNIANYGKMAYASSVQANSFMSGFPVAKNTSSSGKNDKDDKEKKKQETHDKHMALLSQQEADEKRFIQESAIRKEQSDIDAMTDGAAKKFRQLELNQRKEKEALKKEQEELIKQRTEKAKAVFDAGEEAKKADDDKHVKAEFDPKSVETNDIKNEFKTRNTNLETKHQNDLRSYFESERQAMDEHLKAYDTYEKKRAAILALGESRKKGKSDEDQKLIDEGTQKSLSDLDIKEAENSTAFSQLFSDVKDRSIKDMRFIVAEAQKTLDFIEGGNWDAQKGEELGIKKESFDALQGAPEEIAKIKKNIAEMNTQANASNTALTALGDGFEKVFSSKGDPGRLKAGLDQIGGALNNAMQSTRFFGDCLASLGESFDNEALSSAAEGINVAMDAAGAAMSGAQAGAALGPWGAAAGAAIGLVSSLSSSLAKLHDAKNEKNIQRIQEQIEVLEKSYENLGDSLDKAFSTDASNLIDQQNTLLEQQKVLIKQQIAEEQGKKKADQGRIDDWQNQIEEIDKVIAGNKEKKIDVIFGEDLKAAIENFAQAYADAWSAGDDRAKSSKDLVKNMIKQMISEAIKAASSEPMERLRKKLAGYFTDGVITDWERGQIERDAEKIMNDLDRQFGWADEYMQGDEKESSSQDSTKGGFANMSQETGDELNGRFTALQVSNEEIRNSMLLVLMNLSSLCTTTSDGNILLSEMRNLAIMSNGHLEDIAKHTKVLLGFGQKLDNIDSNTRSLTSK